MKKTMLIALVLCLAVAITGCSSKSALEQATKLTAEQSAEITEVLTGVGVQYETVAATDLSTLPAASGLDSATYKAYQLKDKAGNSFFLVLQEANIIAIVDLQSGAYLYGSTTVNG